MQLQHYIRETQQKQNPCEQQQTSLKQRYDWLTVNNSTVLAACFFDDDTTVSLQLSQKLSEFSPLWWPLLILDLCRCSGLIDSGLTLRFWTAEILEVAAAAK